VLDAGALQAVRGEIRFDASGLAPADPALARAIGTTISGRTGFDWRPDNAVDLNGLTITGADYSLQGDLRADGLSSGVTVSGRLTGGYQDLSRLSELAGQPLKGRADLQVEGLLTLLGRSFDAEIALTGTDVAIGQPQLDRLLAGNSSVTASVRRDAEGIEVREAKVEAARLSARASGTITTEGSDLTATLRLASLADVDPALAGALQAEARLTGPADARKLTLNGGATDLLTGVAQLDAALQGRTELAAEASQSEGGWRVDNFRLSNPQLSAEGQGSLAPGAIDTSLRFAVPQIGALQPGWSGALQGNGRIADTPAGLRLTLEGTGEELRFGQADVDGALSGTTRFSVEALRKNDGLTLERAEVVNDQARISASGTLGGTGTDLTGTAEIKALESLGRGWKGALSLQGRVADDSNGRRRFDLTGTGQGLKLGQAQADAALTGTTQIALQGSQGPEGVTIEQGRIANDQAQITAQGTIGAQGTNFTGTAKVATLESLGLGLKGSLDLTGSFRDDGGGARRLTVGGTGQNLAFGQEQVDGALTGTTRLDLRGVERDGVFTIEAAELVNDQATITATGTVGQGRTDATAHVELRRLESLGLGWRGSVMADGTLQDDGSGARRFAVEGTARDLSLGQAQVDAALSGATHFTVRGVEQAGVVTLEEAVVDNPRLSADVSGTVGDGQTDIAGRLRADSLAFLGRGLRGGITAEGRVVQRGATLEIAAEGEARGLGIGNAQADALLAGVTRFDVAAQQQGDDLRIERLQVSNPQLRISASGSLAQGVTLDARLANLDLLAHGFSGPATAAGTVRRQGNRLAVDLALTGPGGTSARVAGTAAQDFSTADLAITGRSDAAIANPFLRVRSIEGPVDFDLQLNGKPGLQALRGRVSLPNARFSDPRFGVRIDDLRAVADFQGDSARIDASGALSDGGTLAIQGHVGLAAGAPLDLDLRLQDAVLRDPNLYETSVTGELRVTGIPAQGPTVAGRLTLGRSEIRIPSTGLGGAKDIPKIIHIGERPPSRTTRAKAGLTPFPGAEATEAGLAGPPATPPTVAAKLDLTLSAPQQVFIRGRGVDAEMGGEIRLTGTARNVIPIGMLELIRGRVDLLGKRFTLSEGRLELQGSLIPVIHLVAQTQQDGITTLITIDGEARDPKITFSSIPDMPQEEVLSQLLFGRGLENISALQAAQLANAVAVLAGQGGAGIVDQLRSSVGLDDLDLGTDDDGNVTLRAGKYLTDRIYTNVEVGGDGKSRVNINLDITNALRARGSVDNEGDSSLGLYYERDY